MIVMKDFLKIWFNIEGIELVKYFLEYIGNGEIMEELYILFFNVF